MARQGTRYNNKVRNTSQICFVPFRKVDKPIPKKIAETEETLPSHLPEVLPDTNPAPAVSESRSEVEVIPKITKKEFLPIISEENSETEMETSEITSPATTGNNRTARNRKIPEKLWDFVVYKVSQSETTSS